MGLSTGINCYILSQRQRSAQQVFPEINVDAYSSLKPIQCRATLRITLFATSLIAISQGQCFECTFVRSSKSVEQPDCLVDTGLHQYVHPKPKLLEPKPYMRTALFLAAT